MEKKETTQISKEIADLVMRLSADEAALLLCGLRRAGAQLGQAVADHLARLKREKILLSFEDDDISAVLKNKLTAKIDGLIDELTCRLISEPRTWAPLLEYWAVGNKNLAAELEWFLSVQGDDD